MTTMIKSDAEARTFANVKSAKKAVGTSCAKLPEHIVITEVDFDDAGNGRVRPRIHFDHTPAALEVIDLKCVEGFALVANCDVEPAGSDAADADELTVRERIVLLHFRNCSGYDNAETMISDTGSTWSDAKDCAKDTGLEVKSVKGVLGSLAKKGLIAVDDAPNGEPGTLQCLTDDGVRAAFDLNDNGDVIAELQSIKKAKSSKPAKASKPRTKRAKLFSRPAADSAKPVKKGTKRADLMTALIAGATAEDIAKFCIKKDGKTPWSKSSTRAAHTTFWTSMGYGIEEKPEGTFTLILPKGAKLADLLT